eukprot:10629432-Ditylum_brightwellii.AAC.1
MFKTLKSFWLPHLSGSQSESVHCGHQLEELGTKQLLKENQLSELFHVINVGLVQKKLKNYAKTTIDFLDVMNDEIVGIEMKAHLSIFSYQKQMGTLMELCWTTSSTSDQQYFAIHAESDLIQTYIESTHKLIQILHHADLTKVMLVTLSDDGK